MLPILRRETQLIGDRDKIVLRQRFRARHQRDVRVPEFLGIVGGFHQFGRAPREVASGNGPMPEHVAQAIAELTADFRNALVSRAAMRAIVTAIFHERDRRIVWAEHMIPRVVHGTIETMVHFL